MIVKIATAMSLVLASCAPVSQANEATPTAKPEQKCVQPQIILRKPGDNMAPNSTYYSDSAPPERFRGNNQTKIAFLSPEEVTKRCSGGAPPTCGLRIMACEDHGTLVMPNPCLAISDYYSRLLCHELGHLNGWPGTHGD